MRTVYELQEPAFDKFEVGAETLELIKLYCQN
jgi:hypothetical protein